jgi:hypothetical protein
LSASVLPPAVHTRFFAAHVWNPANAVPHFASEMAVLQVSIADWAGAGSLAHVLFSLQTALVLGAAPLLLLEPPLLLLAPPLLELAPPSPLGAGGGLPASSSLPLQALAAAPDTRVRMIRDARRVGFVMERMTRARASSSSATANCQDL